MVDGGHHHIGAHHHHHKSENSDAADESYYHHSVTQMDCVLTESEKVVYEQRFKFLLESFNLLGFSESEQVVFLSFAHFSLWHNECFFTQCLIFLEIDFQAWCRNSQPGEYKL
jgi:hypothetical protein